MKRIALVPSLAIILALFAPPASCQIELEWSRKYGWDLSPMPFRLDRLPDGNYIVGAYGAQYQDTTYHAILFKFDANGDSLWFHSKMTGLSRYFPTMSILQDSSILLVCNVYDNATGIYNISLSNRSLAGEELWERDVRMPEGGILALPLIYQNGDSEIILSALTVDSLVVDRDIHVIAFSPDGDSLWSRIYENEEAEYYYPRFQLRDGAILWIGRRAANDSLNQSDLVLRKFDRDENLEWDLTLPRMPSEYIFGAVENPVGHIFVAGNSEPPEDTTAVFIYKITPNGELVGELTIRDYLGQNGHLRSGNNLLLDNDGYLWIAGYDWMTNRAWLLRLDSDCSIDWEAQWGDVRGITDMCQSHDGRILFAGPVVSGARDSLWIASSTPFLRADNRYELYLPGEIALLPPYPSPFNSFANLTFITPFIGDARVILYDITGKLIQSFTHPVYRPGFVSFSIDGSNLSGGVYLVRVEQNDRSAATRIVLVK